MVSLTVCWDKLKTMINLTFEPDVLKFRKTGIVSVEFAPSDNIIKTLEGEVHCSAGDAIVTSAQGESWPVARAHFDEMYEPAGDFAHGLDGAYRKKSSVFILAKQMDTPFKVTVGQGDVLTGKPGDWLTQYSDGQQGIVADVIFRKTYQRI